jgi:Flp pilus assembly protein CpaB
MSSLSDRTRHLLIAVLAGVVVMGATFALTSRASSGGTSTAGGAAVLVATRQIAVGTSATALSSSGAVKTVDVVPGDRVAGAVTSLDSLGHLVVTEPIFSGEQITSKRFGSANEQGVRFDLKGTLRLTQLSGDANQVLAGTLVAGDHVDVLASIRNPESGQDHFSNTILRDLLVTGVEASSTPSSSGSTSTSWVDLVLTNAQADRLFWVEQNADWTLVLRPSVGAKDVPSTVQSSASVLSGHVG